MGNPIDGTDKIVKSRMMTMYRSLDIREQPLTPGRYFLEYQVIDMFNRAIPLDRVAFDWDGEHMTLADGTAWEGEITVVCPTDGK